MDQCALRVLILGCLAVDSGGNFRVSSSVIMRNLPIFHLLLLLLSFFLMLSILVVVVVRNSLRTTIFSRKRLTAAAGARTQQGKTLHGARV
jgi:lipopolysaccharide/colanic/teichoic acid biosynthesis glycosyltransferase